VTAKGLTKSFNSKEGTSIKRKIDNLIYTYQEKCAIKITPPFLSVFLHYSLLDSSFLHNDDLMDKKNI